MLIETTCNRAGAPFPHCGAAHGASGSPRAPPEASSRMCFVDRPSSSHISLRLLSKFHVHSNCLPFFSPPEIPNLSPAIMTCRTTALPDPLPAPGVKPTHTALPGPDHTAEV